MSRPILEVKNIRKAFITKKRKFHPNIIQVAVDDVSFTLNEGETIGLVGESGCGKSTITKMLVRLLPYDAGSIKLDGKEVKEFSKQEFRKMRPQVQLIQQNPFNCMNPRKLIVDTLSEGILEHGIVKNKEEAVAYLLPILRYCGMNEEHLNRYPHEFSGGELQRLAIARAVALNPRFIIADEIVSALDIAIQNQILELLLKLKREKNLSMIFISHDLGVIRKMSDKILVMKEGKIVDSGNRKYIFEESQCEYTKTLLDAMVEFKY